MAVLCVPRACARPQRKVILISNRIPGCTTHTAELPYLTCVGDTDLRQTLVRCTLPPPVASTCIVGRSIPCTITSRSDNVRARTVMKSMPSLADHALIRRVIHTILFLAARDLPTRSPTRNPGARFRWGTARSSYAPGVDGDHSGRSLSASLTCTAHEFGGTFVSSSFNTHTTDT